MFVVKQVICNFTLLIFACNVLREVHVPSCLRWKQWFFLSVCYFKTRFKAIMHFVEF